jgi:hypothetical protein
MNSRFIIGGDFNAEHTHWGSRLITTKGRELYKAVTDTGCENVRSSLLANQRIGPQIQKKLPDLIDFFVVKNISTNYIKIEEGFDLNSDHSPIYLTNSDEIIMKDQNPVLTKKQTKRLGLFQVSLTWYFFAAYVGC